MLFWNAEKTKLMLISVQVIKGRMPNKRGLNYCVYINNKSAMLADELREESATQA